MSTKETKIYFFLIASGAEQLHGYRVCQMFVLNSHASGALVICQVSSPNTWVVNVVCFVYPGA